MVTIRKAAGRDRKQLLALLGKMEDSQEINKAFLSNYVGKRNKLFLVAQGDKKIIGYLLAHLEKRHPSEKANSQAKLEEIYIEKKWRKKGLGNELLKGFYAWAKEKKIKNVRVYTETKNISAISFWEKNGFSETMKMMDKKL